MKAGGSYATENSANMPWPSGKLSALMRLTGVVGLKADLEAGRWLAPVRAWASQVLLA